MNRLYSELVLQAHKKKTKQCGKTIVRHQKKKNGLMIKNEIQNVFHRKKIIGSRLSVWTTLSMFASVSLSLFLALLFVFHFMEMLSRLELRILTSQLRDIHLQTNK